jgi:hypothetical protein
LFERLTTVGSGKGKGAKFPPVSLLIASLKKFYENGDDALFPLVLGTYAPTAVRKMFDECSPIRPWMRHLTTFGRRPNSARRRPVFIEAGRQQGGFRAALFVCHIKRFARGGSLR